MKTQWGERVLRISTMQTILCSSYNFRNMQANLDDLVKKSERIGLKVNIKKTKDLCRTTEAFIRRRSYVGEDVRVYISQGLVS